jgi:hypothetical protein
VVPLRPTTVKFGFPDRLKLLMEGGNVIFTAEFAIKSFEVVN